MIDAGFNAACRLVKKNLTFKWENGWRLPTLKYFS